MTAVIAVKSTGDRNFRNFYCSAAGSQAGIRRPEIKRDAGGGFFFFSQAGVAF